MSNAITQDQINTFCSLFQGREDAFALQWVRESSAGFKAVRKSLTEDVIKQHLRGEETVGIYPVVEETTKFLTLDIDTKSGTSKDIAQLYTQALNQACKRLGLGPILEDSGNKGYHLWLFFEDFAPTKDILDLAKIISANCSPPPEGVSVEVFPKQEKAADLGNLIKLPLGIHKKTGNRCWFLNEDFTSVGRPSVEDQIEYLKSVKICTHSDVLEIIHRNREKKKDQLKLKVEGVKSNADVEKMAESCPVLEHLTQKAEETKHLSHDERLVLCSLAANLGKKGEDWLHKVIKSCTDYDHKKTQYQLENYRQKGRKPFSCEEIKKRLQTDLCQCELEPLTDSETGETRKPSPIRFAFGAKPKVTKAQIEAEIKKIPKDTGKLKLPEILEPILQDMAHLKLTESSTILRHLIKPHFGLTDRDLPAYEQTVKQYREKGKEKRIKTTKVRRKIEITEEEKEVALEFLKDPNLINIVRDDITKIGVIGEDENKVFLYLACTSRKLLLPISLEIKASSGVGKSYIVTKVLELMPEEDTKFFTRITSRYLGYLEEGGLKHKILVVMERGGTEEADYSIRMMVDDTRAGITLGYLQKDETGKTVPVEKSVEGPLCFIQTTTQLISNPENASRLFSVYLDEGEVQRKRVHRVIRENVLPHLIASGEEIATILRKHQTTQRLLKPHEVAIPYAELIEFPIAQYRSSRDLKRFLSVIKSSTLLHQFQRETAKVRGREYLIATVNDYRIAYDLARKILVESLQEISPSSIRVLEASAAIQKEREDKGENKTHTRRDIEKRLGWEPYKVLRAIKPLEDGGYYEVDQKRKPFRYELVYDLEKKEADLKGILIPEELEEKILKNQDQIADIYSE